LIPFEEAQRRIVERLAPLTPRTVALRDARGLVLAEDVVAPEPVPPFANTAMDGYAVRAADTSGASAEHAVRLRIVGELAAGHAPSVAVGAGEAIRIMTGAPVPPGADAIVMVERTTADGDTVSVLAEARLGEHLRDAGGDIVMGACVFESGTVLTPAHLGVLASIDVHEIAVHPRPRVGVLSTGDELVEHGPLSPGQIRDSNRPMLLAVVEEAGCEAVNYGIAPDDESLIVDAITKAVGECDVLLTSGAVSMGDYDYVKTALERLGAERPSSSYEWLQVAIKPAKPLAFAMLGKGDDSAATVVERSAESTHGHVPVFGLPGNPVSSRVSFELFARPAIRRLMGLTEVFPVPVNARAGSAMPRRPDGKVYLDRVRVRVDDGEYVCERAGVQASNVLSGMAAANGLALLPDGDGVDVGAQVSVLLLGPVA
jgi:molybdenum cofactor synthesis domain-containing protein